jgi:hypothetical protein
MQARENWTSTARGSTWSFNATAPGTTTQVTSMILGQGVIVGGGAVNDPGVGAAAIVGAGQTSYTSFDTNGALGGAILLGDTSLAANAGGAIVFSASGTTWRYAAIKGLLADGASNTRGDVAVQTRRVATDATLTNTAVFTASTGQCFNTSGTWTSFSDASLKQDVQPYTRGLDAIVQLNPVAFRYQKGTPFAPRDEPSQILFGLVAQDVEPHIPEIVGSTTATVGEEQREVATLNGGDLIYALINSVKELNAKIAALEAGLPPGLTPLPAE